MDMIFSKLNMEAILDHIGDGVQIIDSRGKILYCNRTVAELDDISREDAIGKHILEVYPSLSHQTSTLLRAIQSGMASFDVQQTFLNYKGKKITTVNTSFPIKARDKVIGAIEISRNITDVRELSEKVMDLQEKLLSKNTKGKSKKLRDGARYSFEDIVGKSYEILKVKNLAMKAAQTSSPVLVYGETGTGKELFVHAIHEASPRRNHPLVAQNCAALPATLLEGILFGTVKGGFTGADDRAGLFELADGGTLFLDEINSMPLELQAKLLRVLQDGLIRRVGDIKTRQVDVRVITASNQDPQLALEQKQLRTDLYYRLNVVNLRIPELKERQEDIALLTWHFIDKYNQSLGKSITSVAEEVFDIFHNYSWPGNVRELEHVIEGAMNIIDGSRLSLEYLPLHMSKFTHRSLKINSDKDMGSLKDAIEQLEREIIEKALNQWDWNISHTADSLEVPRQTLQYKIKKYKLKNNPQK